ncbi:MAG: radical SAM protein [Bacteroidales bacterium]
MELSKHNIISKVHQSDDYFIVNALSGNADLLSSDEARDVFDNRVLNNSGFIEKGYVVDPDEEQKRFRLRYLDFLDSRDTDEIQLFYAPTYACNFACSYCYQEGYPKHNKENSAAVANAFFSYVNAHFAGKKKYVTLFGGEPLLAGDSNRHFLEHFISRCNENGLELAVVTNGYYLETFVPLLATAAIREVQVTLDGSEEIHNSRRSLKGGQGTFSNITAGIDAALKSGIPVNLRVVLDRDNMNTLPELADFAISRGWTSHPGFKTQLGRNYELHYCQSQQSKLYSRIEMYQDLFKLIGEHPEILSFHKPAFSVSRFLFENDELPDPLFDSCPGCKTEWAFDYTGRIYSCTATVGKPEEELGTFWPHITLNKRQVELWQQRDVLSISACTSCNLRLLCGGGCASVAYNRDKHLHAPDCRPVKELMELGFALYGKKM